MSLIITQDITPGFITLTGNNTLASNTSLRAAFNVPSNGAFNAKANITYFFEIGLSLSSISSSSGNIQFGFLGNASITGFYTGLSRKSASAVFGTSNLASVALTASDATTTCFLYLNGKLVCTGAGTIIPAVTGSVAAAIVVNSGSWFKIYPAGSNTVTVNGDFS